MRHFAITAANFSISTLVLVIEGVFLTLLQRLESVGLSEKFQ